MRRKPSRKRWQGSDEEAMEDDYYDDMPMRRRTSGTGTSWHATTMRGHPFAVGISSMTLWPYAGLDAVGEATCTEALEAERDTPSVQTPFSSVAKQRSKGRLHAQ
jgi:hypothetical protein